MRHRIVGVNQLDLKGLGQIDQLCRQGEGVRGILQEGIGCETNLVHVHVRVKTLQAKGGRVADDVDLVAPFREPDGQLRRHDTAPAMGRITKHSDLHGIVSRHSGPKNSTGSSILSASRTRNGSPNLTPT